MISICEPYWERPEALRCQLESFRRFYGDLVEVVICDDGSPTQPARPVVEEFPDLNIVLIENPVKEADLDPCVPTNQAVAASSGDWVVLSQADIEHPQDVVFRMLEVVEQAPLTEKPVAYPGCINAVRNDSGSLWRCVPFTVMPALDCVMLRRSDWLGMGEEYREGYAFSDYDLWMKMMAGGYVFLHVPNLLVVHRNDLCAQWKPSDQKPRQDRNHEWLREKFGSDDGKFVVQIAPADVAIVSSRFSREKEDGPWSRATG